MGKAGYLLTLSFALVVAGCSFDEGGIPSSVDAGVSPPADAPIGAADTIVTPTPDGAVPNPDASVCADLAVNPSNFDECAVGASNGTLVVTPGFWLLDVDAGTLDENPSNPGNPPVPVTSVELSQAGGPNIVVLVYDSITIQTGGNFSIVGSKPVVLVSLADITVNGSMYVQAVGGTPGPGGNLAGYCDNGKGENAGTDDGVGGGGGGGGFGVSGGNGAPAENTFGVDSLGGSTEGNAVLIPLRGGCGGGSGGGGGGVAGGGGGALQLVANDTISIPGNVIARGGGGRGAQGVQQGGGGGGSGGGILLEAQNVTVSGSLTANGGGGGEGSYGGGMFAGENGEDGNNLLALPALGGFGGGFGGDGGNGAAGVTSAEPGFIGVSDDTPGAGGGGGGGGVGRIHINATSLNTAGATITPPAQ